MKRSGWFTGTTAVGTVKSASGGPGGSGKTVTVLAALSLPALLVTVWVTVKVPDSSQALVTFAPWAEVLSPNSQVILEGLFSERSLRRISSPTTTSRLDSPNRAIGGATAGSTSMSTKVSSVPALLETTKRIR